MEGNSPTFICQLMIIQNSNRLSAVFLFVLLLFLFGSLGMIIYKYTYSVFSGNQHGNETMVTHEKYVLNNTRDSRFNFCEIVGESDNEFIDFDDFKNKSWNVGFDIKVIEVSDV